MNGVFADSLRLLVLVAGLVVPGALLLRALRLPRSLAGAFCASAALLSTCVMVFAFLHIPISAATLGLGLAIVSAPAAWFGRGAVAPVTENAGEISPLRALGFAAIPYALFWIVVIFRLGTDPLSGPDIQFRWARLATEILKSHSLDFYPAVTGADFQRYYWPESIPPGVGALYVWAFGCGGSASPHWTTPVILLELVSLHELVWRLARPHGTRVAALALLLLSACPLLNWTFLIGQETGLLAVGVVAIVLGLDLARREPQGGGLFLAGIGAIVAGSTREYGPAFVVFAVVAAFLQRESRTRSWIVAAISVPPCALWLAWVTMRTGNPFYSLDVLGAFPVNAIFVEWNDSFRAAQKSVLASVSGWESLARYLGIWAIPSVLGLFAWLIPAIRRSGGALVLASAVTLSIAIWVWSVGYTAGGLFYSLRVLAPALALLVIPAARGIEAIASSNASRQVVLVLTLLLALEALPKTLVLPDNSYRVPVSEWTVAAQRISAGFRSDETELVAALQRLSAHAVISDGFALTVPAEAAGIRVAPIWSPDCEGLFRRDSDPVESSRRLKEAGLRFIVVGTTGTLQNWVREHARLELLGLEFREVGRTSGHVIFELRSRGP
ncbi:MAG TPA: hypothetical protein VHD32_04490 [Candidatus Didemnitutus sp.]|nr:hypothetical protein [Candidatus Didemnitutus sp.]